MDTTFRQPKNGAKSVVYVKMDSNPDISRIILHFFFFEFLRFSRDLKKIQRWIAISNSYGLEAHELSKHGFHWL